MHHGKEGVMEQFKSKQWKGVVEAVHITGDQEVKNKKQAPSITFSGPSSVTHLCQRSPTS